MGQGGNELACGPALHMDPVCASIDARPFRQQLECLPSGSLLRSLFFSFPILSWVSFFVSSFVVVGRKKENFQVAHHLLPWHLRCQTLEFPACLSWVITDKFHIVSHEVCTACDGTCRQRQGSIALFFVMSFFFFFSNSLPLWTFAVDLLPVHSESL